MKETLIKKPDLSSLSASELMEKLDPLRMPRHVAVIMDGNGRWAKQKGLPRIAGHKKGMETVKSIVTTASDLGIKALTLYAFSLENWRRPAREVEALMSLLTIYLQREIAMMNKNNIRFTAIGRLDDLPDEARKWVEKAGRETGSNTGMVLDLALSYGGRWEIMAAAKKFHQDIMSGRINQDDIDEKTFGGYMTTTALPELDLVIRTSGEQRISNFLLWQAAYAELYFTEALWPDFGDRELLAALVDYQSRERRFGKTGEQIIGREDAI